MSLRNSRINPKPSSSRLLVRGIIAAAALTAIAIPLGRISVTVPTPTVPTSAVALPQTVRAWASLALQVLRDGRSMPALFADAVLSLLPPEESLPPLNPLLEGPDVRLVPELTSTRPPLANATPAPHHDGAAADVSSPFVFPVITKRHESLPPLPEDLAALWEAAKPGESPTAGAVLTDNLPDALLPELPDRDARTLSVRSLLSTRKLTFRLRPPAAPPAKPTSKPVPKPTTTAPDGPEAMLHANGVHEIIIRSFSSEGTVQIRIRRIG